MATEREVLYARIENIEGAITRLTKAIEKVADSVKPKDWLDAQAQGVIVAPNASYEHTQRVEVKRSHHATHRAPKKARYIMRDDERARLISIYVNLREQFPSLTTYKLAKRVKQASGTTASKSTIWHLLINYGAPRDGKQPCPSAMRNGAHHP